MNAILNMDFFEALFDAETSAAIDAVNEWKADPATRCTVVSLKHQSLYEAVAQIKRYYRPSAYWMQTLIGPRHREESVEVFFRNGCASK